MLAMCNLLAASANDIADLKRSYDAQNKGNQMPFNALLMPEMATLQDASGTLSLTAQANSVHSTCCGGACFAGQPQDWKKMPLMPSSRLSPHPWKQLPCA